MNKKEQNKNYNLERPYLENEDLSKTFIKYKDSFSDKLEQEREMQKYIKEMHEMADKNEKMNNVAFMLISFGFLCIISLPIILNSSSIFANKNSDDKAVVLKVENDNKSSESSNKPSNTKEDTKTSNSHLQISETIYKYAHSKENRAASLKTAISLNGKSKKGVTGYLLSEIFRNCGFDIAKSTCNIEQLMKALSSANFKKNTDLSQLKKGDICFTTDMPEKPGVPGHAYIFMGWVKEGKTDYAYVCDGQVDEYKDTLHKRNIDFSTPQKDKFKFFMTIEN